VKMLGGVNYEHIAPEGVWVSFGANQENPTVIAADTVVLCAGQTSNRALAEQLLAAGRSIHIIGGADIAGELDAKRAIDQGTRLAMRL
jgi:2,4-dienoyl-CoA reductase (NADPH2)